MHQCRASVSCIVRHQALMSNVVARNKRWRTIALGGAGLLVVLWLVWIAPVPFVRSWWRSADLTTGGPLHLRQRMADWLVLTHSLDGKSSAEVVELLGIPPSHDKFRGPGLVYVLGRERGFVSIDFEWLVLIVGKAGTVENAAVVTD
jgi:hypothetical protein